MDAHKKNTKIVATISDIRCDVDFLRKLYENGMNIVRMNTAHMTFDGMKKVIANTRQVSNKIGILVDTKGPEVRVANVSKDIEFKVGQETFFVNSNPQENEICTSYPTFVEDVPTGSKVLIHDGRMSFKVIGKENGKLKAICETEGVVKNKKNLNVPGVHLNVPALTDKDKEFLKLAKELDIEFVAHSFVRNKEDLIEVQGYLDSIKARMKVISKIENREGVDNIEEILDHCYGVMVARGDLGVEVFAAEVPLIQKMIIEKCLRKAKPVIVATQMLESMIHNPRPTRAEVSDVANAILDGTSAIMLSGETTEGKFAVEAVRTMTDIALQLHDRPRNGMKFEKQIIMDPVLTMAKAAAETALLLDAKAIIVPTISGRSARYISSLRTRIPIYALCYDEFAMRKLALSHGVKASKFEICKTTDELVTKSVKEVYDLKEINKEDTIIILAGNPQHTKDNSVFIEVLNVGEELSKIKN